MAPFNKDRLMSPDNYPKFPVMKNESNNKQILRPACQNFIDSVA